MSSLSDSLENFLGVPIRGIFIGGLISYIDTPLLRIGSEVPSIRIGTLGVSPIASTISAASSYLRRRFVTSSLFYSIAALRSLFLRGAPTPSSLGVGCAALSSLRAGREEGVIRSKGGSNPTSSSS